jgi:DNA polymerase
VDLDRRKNIYIANMVKCRPPGNRDPKPEEQDLCVGWLKAQVQLMQPKIIVCLGRIAAQRVIGKEFKVSKEHGVFFERNGMLRMGMYHPAKLLRDANLKPEALQDFLTLREKIAEICERTYPLAQM